MRRAIVYDRSILDARMTCIRLRKQHRLESVAVHPTDFDLTFDDAGPPALLVTELAMPLFSGVELVRQVRSVWSAQALPIIVYTSSDDSTSWSELRRLGVSDIVLRSGEEAITRFDRAVQAVLGSDRPMPIRERTPSRLARLFSFQRTATATAA